MNDKNKNAVPHIGTDRIKEFINRRMNERMIGWLDVVKI